MASLVAFPSSSDAFSAYKPSTNAHTDIITGATSGARAKVVKLNLRPAHRPAESTSILDSLKSSVPRLLAGERTDLSYHAIVDACRRIALGPHAEALYNHINHELAQHVKQMAKSLSRSIMAKDGLWLEKLIDTYDEYETRVDLLAALFVYLDRVYCTEGSLHEPIKKLAEIRFRSHVWCNQLVFQKTRDDILAWVTAERETEQSNSQLRPLVASVVSLSQVLGTFDSLAEPYLELTQSHYETIVATQAANVESGSLTGTEYVKWALGKEDEERARAQRFMSPKVAQRVVKMLRHENGEKVANQVVQKALDEAMYRDDIEALTRLYRFCTQSQSFKVFAKALQGHIETRIRSVISDPANDPQMIDSTLKLKRFADRAVASVFSMPTRTIQASKEKQVETESMLVDLDTRAARTRAVKESTQPRVADEDESPEIDENGKNNQLDLEDAVRNGFKSGLGSRQNAPAEWIAKHLDAAMRKGQGSGTEDEFNALLDEIIALVGFTRDKDVFRAFYASGLAKRLLLNKSASDDMERNMIVKLQNAMGDEFTSGDVMMKDLQLSETLVKSYQSARSKEPQRFKDNSDFTANVLTESAWPPYPLLKDGWDFKLTPELQSSIDSFTAWYATQHKNRKLSWRHQLGSVTLTARFASGKYEIGVSLFQAVVLLQFNEADVLDFKQLKDRTGIESSELVRTLQSLAIGRKGTRVLVKRPPGKDVEPTDKFAFNKAFTSDRIKFKINQIQQDLSAEESRQTNQQVAIDRVSVLEATIVRIMKGRKKMTLTLLIDAVVSDVSKRFPPDVKEIKKRMESLIEREFLMRDERDRNTLHYLA